MAEYAQWNDALCDWFFRPELAGQPVYLACDLSVPAAVAEAEGWALDQPLEDLLQAVRTQLSRPEPLNRAFRDAVGWRRRGRIGNPPFVAVLAVTVLAAAGGGRVDNLPTLHERAYYQPLRRLLGFPPGAQPPSFDSDVKVLWTLLGEWLDSHLHGARGRSTAQSSKHLPNVGWALSQTLLTAGERSRLPHFFRAVGASPGEDIAGEVLATPYLRWAARQPGARIATLDRGSAAHGLVGDVLHQTLLTWDGRTRDERGRLTLPLRIAYHAQQAALHLSTRVPPGLGGVDVWIEGQRVTLVEPGEALLLPGDAGAALSGRPVSVLFARLGGKGEAVQARLSPAVLRILAADAELAMWVEVNAAQFGLEHVVLVQTSAAPAVERAMTELGSTPVRLERARLPEGWRAYHHFAPTRLGELQADLAALVPSAGELAQLSGGLPVDVRTRLWLTGGAPDLRLAGGTSDPAGVVLVDGNELPAHEGELALNGLGLSAGSHEVIVGGRHMQFSLIDEVVDQDGRGDVRLTVDRRPVRHPLAGSGTRESGQESTAAALEVTVCGASVVESSTSGAQLALPPLRHVRAGGRYYALGMAGQAARPHPCVPSWLGNLEPRPYPRDVDVTSVLSGLDFAPAWLLHVPPLGRPTVEGLSEIALPTKPQSTTLTETGDQIWADAARYFAAAEPSLQDEDRWKAWLVDVTGPGVSERSAAAPPMATVGLR